MLHGTSYQGARKQCYKSQVATFRIHDVRHDSLEFLYALFFLQGLCALHGLSFGCQTSSFVKLPGSIYLALMLIEFGLVAFAQAYLS